MTPYVTSAPSSRQQAQESLSSYALRGYHHHPHHPPAHTIFAHTHYSSIPPQPPYPDPLSVPPEMPPLYDPAYSAHYYAHYMTALQGRYQHPAPGMAPPNSGSALPPPYSVPRPFGVTPQFHGAHAPPMMPPHGVLPPPFPAGLYPDAYPYAPSPFAPPYPPPPHYYAQRGNGGGSVRHGAVGSSPHPRKRDHKIPEQIIIKEEDEDDQQKLKQEQQQDQQQQQDQKLDDDKPSCLLDFIKSEGDAIVNDEDPARMEVQTARLAKAHDCADSCFSMLFRVKAGCTLQPPSELFKKLLKTPKSSSANARKASPQPKDEPLPAQKPQQIRSKYNNYTKLFMNNLFQVFHASYLDNIDFPKCLKPEILRTVQRVRMSGKRHEKNAFKTDIFNHSHYNVLFLKITPKSLLKMATVQKDIDLHRAVYDLDLRTADAHSDRVQRINLIKHAIYEIVRVSILRGAKVEEVNTSSAAGGATTTTTNNTTSAIAALATANTNTTTNTAAVTSTAVAEKAEPSDQLPVPPPPQSEPEQDAQQEPLQQMQTEGGDSQQQQQQQQQQQEQPREGNLPPAKNSKEEYEMKVLQGITRLVRGFPTQRF